MKKLIFGVGINDADYAVEIKQSLGYDAEGKRIQKKVFVCRFYKRWASVIERCYSEKFHLKSPTYSECTTSPEWHYFMNFRGWMIQQNWEGKHLDKDLLFPGNKIYGPETCVFVDQKVNSFLTENNSRRGEWPIGASFVKEKRKFLATCCNVMTGKQVKLGYYNDPVKAHEAWLSYKLEQAKILAAQQTDERVAKALVARYENYQL